jgi:hypothetical protein
MRTTKATFILDLIPHTPDEEVGVAGRALECCAHRPINLRYAIGHAI